MKETPTMTKMATSRRTPKGTNVKIGQCKDKFECTLPSTKVQAEITARWRSGGAEQEGEKYIFFPSLLLFLLVVLAVLLRRLITEQGKRGDMGGLRFVKGSARSQMTTNNLTPPLRSRSRSGTLIRFGSPVARDVGNNSSSSHSSTTTTTTTTCNNSHNSHTRHNRIKTETTSRELARSLKNTDQRTRPAQTIRDQRHPFSTPAQPYKNSGRAESVYYISAGGGGGDSSEKNAGVRQPISADDLPETGLSWEILPGLVQVPRAAARAAVVSAGDEVAVAAAAEHGDLDHRREDPVSAAACEVCGNGPRIERNPEGVCLF